MLDQFTNKPDIITLTDNKLPNTVNPNSYQIKGYKHKHTQDVTVYHNNNLYVTYLDIDIPQSASITLQTHNNKQANSPNHTVISIYRRPRPIANFREDLQKAINSILAEHPQTPITIQGDININLLKMTYTHPLVHFLVENNLHTTITTPTRYDPYHKSATLIDVNLTTETQIAVTAGTISPPLSDHLPTLTIFHKPTTRKNKNTQPTLSIRQYTKHKQQILTDIKTEITNNQTKFTTTSEIFDNLQQTIKQVIETHEKNPKPIRKPWCNREIQRQIKEQHRLHQLRIKNPTQHNIIKHQRHRTQLNKQIKTAKKQHIADQLQRTKNDPKQQAKILKTLIPSSSQHRTSPTIIVYEGKQYSDPTDIANALNDRFITIGRKTSQEIPHQNEYTPPEVDNHTHPPFDIQHTTTDTVTKTMNKINPNKASDIYKIKPAIIKDLTPFLAPILTTLFNKSIDAHKYPDSLKATKVIELYKKKDKTDPANYRPISLLPIIAKLFDTIINEQMMTHLTTNNIISPTQYAFRPNSSTTMALQTIINKIHKHKTNKQPTLAIYIDLSKAYDTISHTALLHKLRHNFNFTETTTQFFASYFQHRPQSVHTQHAQSTTQTITHGIPQGSTLSTTFFLLYINDIIKTTPKSKVYTYADDTTLIITAPTLEALQTLAQSELSNLIHYFHYNNLVPNPTKTTYSIFYPSQNQDHPQPIQLKINETNIKRTNEAKLLGIIIQENMKQHKTVLNIIKKLQPTMHSFKYANRLLPTQTMKHLYYSHVYPHLITNISIWGTSNPKKSYMQPLIRTQKRIIRLITNNPPRTHTNPLMTRLKTLNITNLYILRVCVEIHPFIHSKPDQQLNRPEHNHSYTLASEVHDHQTRYALQDHQFIPQRKHYSKTKQPTFTTEHFEAEHLAIWNSLPADLRNTKSLYAFKTNTKHFLLRKQANTVQ
jgi:hypothetical protein